MGLDPASVRQAYDRVATRYADAFLGELEYKPLDRALLTVLAEDAVHEGRGPIGDLGAGPGHVAAFLAGLGADVTALDQSVAMAAIAHERLGVPGVVAGSLTALPYRTGALGGAVAFYSLIHLDDDRLRLAATEVARVVAPGGLLLAAFHIGRGVVHLDTWHGHEVDLDFRFLEPEPVAACLAHAGFVVEATLERAPYPDEVETRRSYILARRAAG